MKFSSQKRYVQRIGKSRKTQYLRFTNTFKGLDGNKKQKVSACRLFI